MPRLSLSEIHDKLEQAVERVERRVEHQARSAGLNPLDMMDTNGRYILLDAYVALAQVRVLLEQRKTFSVNVDPSGDWNSAEDQIYDEKEEFCSCVDGPDLGGRKLWAMPRCSRCRLFVKEEK